ncbi:hypothetical protein SETIT_6G071100v2 [Setaria italica]|uniref:NB-ARC domain-containing protein n=1 Tax=Setaria italica TaxID=4555 RepID=A0A368RKL9_SETIT|nr:hypothetical protein SETIT_6G071100v2 [Setaria italica]
MFKNKELDKLFLQLKYATYDAEDLLRDFEDQALRQRIEDAGRSRAGQLYSSFVNNAAHFLHGSNRRVREAQDKLDEAMAEVEKELSRMGLHVVPEKAMPTTTEIITASEVFGRDTERNEVMEMLGVTGTIDHADKINLVMKQITMGSTSAEPSKRKRAAAAADHGAPVKRLVTATRTSSAGLAEPTNFAGNVSVLPIFGIAGIGKTTLAQLIYNDERVRAHFTVRTWVCVSDLFDDERMTKEIVKNISEPDIDLPCDLHGLQALLKGATEEPKIPFGVG